MKEKKKKKVLIPIPEAIKLEEVEEVESKIERIMIFIDNSSIFKGFQKYDIKVDYEKLKN